MAAHNRVDMTGKSYGQLTVKNYSHTKGKVAYWTCICSCGKEVTAVGTSIRSGNTTSCGHDRYKNAGAAAAKACTIHGMEGTPTYRSWKSMKERCLKPEHKSYYHYGDIPICRRWVNSFKAFYDDMGVRPKGTTLDRIDNEKGYEPGNCRWATHKEQARNKRNNRVIEYRGQEKTLAEWSEITGIPHDTLSWRLKKWGDVEKCLSTPVRAMKPSSEWRKPA